YRRWLEWHSLVSVLRTPTVGVLVLTFFLATFAFGSLESTLALVNALLLTGNVERRPLSPEELRGTLRTILPVLAMVGVVLRLAQGLGSRRLVPRVGEVPFLRAGVALMALGLGAAAGLLLILQPGKAETPILVVALAVMTVAVVGFAFLTPSVQA